MHIFFLKFSHNTEVFISKNQQQELISDIDSKQSSVLSEESNNHQLISLLLLPQEILFHIFHFIDSEILLMKVTVLSKKFYKLVQNKILGKKLLQHRLSYLNSHTENKDNIEIADLYRLISSLLKEDPELDSKLDWRYFKVHKEMVQHELLIQMGQKLVCHVAY